MRVGGSATLLDPTQSLIAQSDGTSSTSFQVAEAQPPNQLSGTLPSSGHPDQPFSCDSTDPCSIDVTEPYINLNLEPSAANTIAIPITFRSGAACPGASIVTTESEFGIEQLLPQVASLACASQSATPPLALNTALDGVSAVTALTSGAAKVAFTEDPESPDQQALLKKGHYAVIPVALTANVVGFRAYMSGTGGIYPLAGLKLTPTEVAGLATYLYTGPTKGDVAKCPAGSLPQGWCTDPSPCLGPVGGAFSCEILGELNAQPGFILPTVYGSFVRSDASGVTDQLFSWLCQSADTTVTWGGQSATEPTTAAATLIAGLNGGLPPSGQLTSCPSTDTFPALSSFSGAQTSEVGQPSQQLVKMFGWFNNITSASRAGFAPMNWAESLYLGLSVPQLQNAAGDFVAPTAASIDAAVGDAKPNPDGSLAFTYTKADATVYPMPSVIYAVVSTDPMSATDAAHVKGLLSEILDVTGGKDTSQLPGGFVPLTSALDTQAQADVAKDITTTTPTTSKPPSPTTTTAADGPGWWVHPDRGYTVHGWRRHRKCWLRVRNFAVGVRVGRVTGIARSGARAGGDRRGQPGGPIDHRTGAVSGPRLQGAHRSRAPSAQLPVGGDHRTSPPALDGGARPACARLGASVAVAKIPPDDVRRCRGSRAPARGIVPKRFRSGARPEP